MKRVNWKSVLKRWGLFALMIIIILTTSVYIYSLHIDWNSQVRSYGYAGIFIVSFIGSMTIFLPLPGEAVLAVAPAIMQLSGIELIFLSIVASIGASLGELTGYLAGYWGRAVINPKHEKRYVRVEHLMHRFGGPGVTVFALTPLPFDLVGIVAGSLRFPIWKFFLYCWAGRLIRALLVVYLGWTFFHNILSGEV